ncbi:RNA polymerase sigma factor, partial [Ruthenibacterium lactatiformans]|uniref:RNA polymerase sigma factor n=1 Tax=Ruthenibacterium lactatiformans TaxID=1550024 RepID=UPI003AF181AE
MKFDKTAQQCFTDLYKRYYKLMYHVAFEVLHNRVTTEDVVHTSCVRVLEHFSQVSAIDSPQTRNFVAIITKRIALTECSRMKREVPADVPTELENFDDLHETPVVAVERRVPFPVSWTVKMKKKQKETQDILSYHTQAAGCSDKARAKASGGRQPI